MKNVKKGVLCLRSWRKDTINCPIICYYYKEKACKSFPAYDDTSTNSANQEPEIDMMMRRVFSEEVDLLRSGTSEGNHSDQTDINDYDIQSISKNII